jgi:hypothetical protein
VRGAEKKYLNIPLLKRAMNATGQRSAPIFKQHLRAHQHKQQPRACGHDLEKPSHAQNWK